MSSLREILNQNVREGELYEPIERNRLRCYACGHCCPIAEGQAGVCKVRYNQGGKLYVPWGYVGGVQCDPIEKKPFFHAYPGALAYSFGMLGCDLHCSYCQNWVTSQALRDPHAISAPLQASPELLVRDALRQRADLLSHPPVILQAVGKRRPGEATGKAQPIHRRGRGIRDDTAAALHVIDVVPRPPLTAREGGVPATRPRRDLSSHHPRGVLPRTRKAASSLLRTRSGIAHCRALAHHRHPS